MRGVIGAALALGAMLAASGSAATTTEVTTPGKFFAPEHADVLVGTTVTWRNTDRQTHTVTEDEDGFDSGHLRPGSSFSLTFEKSGSFTFHCTIHRFMRGSLGVFEVVLRGPRETVRAGKRVRLEGVAPAGATAVVLEQVRPARGAVGRATPRADGAFAFSLRVPEPRSFVARAGGAASPALRVRVAPSVRIAAGDGVVAISARPARPGTVVVLQRYDRERFDFVPVVRGRLDGSSRASLSYAPEGREHLRAVVTGRAGWSDGVSRVVVVAPRF